jgi:hypothetical protein
MDDVRRDLTSSYDLMTVPVSTAKDSEPGKLKDSGEFSPSGPFTSADEAVIAALKDARANPDVGTTEYAGIVYEQDGKFYYTKPENSGGRDSVDLKVLKPTGSKVAALYHTHGADPKNPDSFSGHDRRTARGLKVPSYILDAGTGNVVSHDYTKDHINRHDKRKTLGFLPGQLITNLNEPSPVPNVRDDLSAAFDGPPTAD